MLKVVPAVFVALFAVACGANQPPAASAPSADSKAADDKAPAPEGGDKKGWADAQREAFMTGCTSRVQAPDYCACSFELFSDVFKDGPRPDGQSPDPRFKVLAERTKTECASKLPEDIVKASFLRSCVEDDKRKAGYCECAWPALRKSLALADFATAFEGPRFDAAKRSMATACKGKFPAEVAKTEFLTACTKDDSSQGHAKACECAWKKLHAKFSVEEIVSGTADLASAGVSECK